MRVARNKGADQLGSHCEADLRLCFRIGNNPVFSRCSSNMVHVNAESDLSIYSLFVNWTDSQNLSLVLTFNHE